MESRPSFSGIRHCTPEIKINVETQPLNQTNNANCICPPLLLSCSSPDGEDKHHKESQHGNLHPFIYLCFISGMYGGLAP